MNQQCRVAFLSTYPPKACGIATFTQDLVRALDQKATNMSSDVIAIENKAMEGIEYSDRVIMKIQKPDKRSYQRAAQKINQSDVDLVVIEHEYGIFGGENGEYILDFINRLQRPFIITLHTILSMPSPKQQYILKKLGAESQKVITMTSGTKKILEDIYQIPAHKIEVIPHGVSLQSQCLSQNELKTTFGFETRRIVSTFGLLSPGKGLEYGIEAIAKITDKYPDILYLILGKTHPCVKEINGEVYREKLEALVHQLDVKNHVEFVNRYLSKKEIAQYLVLSDVYLTPYMDKNQAVSGTLAYAIGYGKMIVSTPYLYAQEVLGDERGLLAQFADADSLATQIDVALAYPKKRQSMELKTAELGKTMLWENVAGRYEKVFEKIMDKIPKES